MEQQRLERLLDVGRTIVSQLDLDGLLEHILDVAREIIGARYAAVGVLDEQRVQLSRFVTSGIDAETKAVIGDLPHGRGVLGELISDPRPLRLTDVGRHPESYGFPVGHPPMRSFLGVPIMVGGAVWGNLYLTEKEDGAFDAEDEQTAGILADWAAVGVANARAFGDEHARRRELERGMAAYEATVEIARALAGETDLDVILELVVKRGRALVSARSMFIGLLDRDELVIVTTAGRLPRDLVGRRIPVDGSSVGRVVRLRRSQRHAALRGGAGFNLGGQVGARASLFVPLLVRGRALGVVAAFDRLEHGPAFGEQDERLMEAFAGSAANAVAMAQSVAAEGVQRAMKAAEDERRRWARELHDDTLQDIGALRVLLGGARQDDDPHALVAAVDHAIDRLADQANVLRALITDLHPVALDRLGVGPAIEVLVDRVRQQAGLEVLLDIRLEHPAKRASDRLTPLTEVAIYRGVQEALSNVVRHAGARHVQVQLRESGGRVTFRITDDGRGFDPDPDAPGFGLIGMRERVRLLDGELTIRSRPGAGTTIEGSVPAIHGSDADSLVALRHVRA